MYYRFCWPLPTFLPSPHCLRAVPWCVTKVLKSFTFPSTRTQEAKPLVEGQRNNKTPSIYLSLSLSLSPSLHLSICSHPVFLFPFFLLEGKKGPEWRLEEESSIYCLPTVSSSNTLSVSISAADLLVSSESPFYTWWGWKATEMMKLSPALRSGIRVLTSVLFQCLSFNHFVILEEFLLYISMLWKKGLWTWGVRIKWNKSC